MAEPKAPSNDGPGRDCPGEEALFAFVEGLLAAPRRSAVEDHLGECTVCRETVSEAVRVFDGDAGGGAQTRTARVDVVTELASFPSARASERVVPRSDSFAPAVVSIGRYVVVRTVGIGGMGVVYEAHDPQLRRSVALKVLRPDVGTVGLEEAREHLLREARVMALLSHPNVVPVFDAGTHGDQVFVAMEFVEGCTLRDWLHKAERSVGEILEVFRAAGAGLAAAHSRGLVHRDFKPTNVLIGDDGRVRVTDFGLARPVLRSDDVLLKASSAAPENEKSASSCAAHRDLLTWTRTGRWVGTPAYMAPEQFDAKPADPRTDQYAFCVTLYEALYARRPFVAANLDELMNLVTRSAFPVPPARIGVSPEVVTALERGLHASSSHRFAQMEDLIGLLRTDAVEPSLRPGRTGKGQPPRPQLAHRAPPPTGRPGRNGRPVGHR